MLDQYFESPRVLASVMSPTFTSHLELFAAALHDVGYAREHIRNQIRGAAHFCTWMEGQRESRAELGDDAVDRFSEHLLDCRCPGPARGTSAAVVRWAQRFVEHLRGLGVVPQPGVGDADRPHPLLEGFSSWMKKHRGVTCNTVRRYVRHLVPLLHEHRDDPVSFSLEKIRGYVRRRVAPGRANVVDVFAAVRMFLRYLAVEGRCRAGLEQALPRVASWSQRRLPRVLPVEDVERLIAACDPTSKVGLRDRAILLLLARLGLRAGDVAGLRLDDLSWEKASLRVVGKGRREALLPVPQDVGDAILAYLERGRPTTRSDFVFLRGVAPFRPVASGGAISLVVRRAFSRAGVESSSRGSHVLRHSLASRMLREGVPLRGIAEVLRHKSVKTTIIYAKVDVDLLARVAEPWPEVSG